MGTEVADDQGAHVVNHHRLPVPNIPYMSHFHQNRITSIFIDEINLYELFSLPVSVFDVSTLKTPALIWFLPG